MAALTGTLPPMDRGGGEQKAPPKPQRRRRQGVPIGAPTNAQRRANAGKATAVKPVWNHSRRGWSVGRDIAAHIEATGGAPNTATATKSRGELSQSVIDNRTWKLKYTSRVRKAQREQENAFHRGDNHTLALWNNWIKGINEGEAEHILDKKWKAALKATKEAEVRGGNTKSAVSEFSSENLNASPISNSSNPNSRPEFYKQAQFPDVFDPKTGKKIGYSVDFPKKMTFKKGRIGGRRRRKTRQKRRAKIHKKTRRNKRRSKRLQKGGMRRRINDTMIQTFVNPHSGVFGHDNDCCPCVFGFLGMPPEQVAAYQQEFGNGFSEDALVILMAVAYPNYRHTFHKSEDVSQANAQDTAILIDGIFSQIPPGTAAIGGIERTDGSKHCIVFARTNIGQAIPLIFDVQASRYYAGAQSIIEYFRGQNVRHTYLMNSTDDEGNPLVLDITGAEEVPVMVQGKQANGGGAKKNANISNTGGGSKQ